MSTVQQVDIIDKNGKRNTVRKRVGNATPNKATKITVRRSVNTEQSLEHPTFPSHEDRKTIDLILNEFSNAVEFRFEFEVDNGSLYLMNRSVVTEDGYCHSDDNADDRELAKLDSVSNRIAEMYHLLGAFGSRTRVRFVDQESENRYVAIRLD